MISRNLYINIVIRVLAIVLLALSAGFAIALGWSWIAPFILLLVLLSVTVNLIRYVNTTNRKLNLFFEAIDNNDSTLHFPKDNSSKTLRELSQRLNEVNQLLGHLKISNQQKEQYFQTLLENVATGIITFNQKGAIAHANNTIRDMLGVHVLTHIKQLERIDAKLYQTVLHIKPDERKLVSLLHRGRATELSLSVTRIRNKGDELSLLVIQDIKSELETRELESWLKLIRVLIHEIMNSIAPITSLSESLARQVPPEGGSASDASLAVIGRGLNVILTQSQRLMRFVESYRELTRLPQPRRHTFEVLGTLNQVKLLFDAQSQGNSIITVSVSPHNLEAYADEEQITQVLINLVKNAMQASGGSPKPAIGLCAQQVNGHVIIEVTDNGSGIPPELLSEIFVPFFSTHEQGTGIGLSISKQIVGQHGGALRVRSAPNRETVFSVEL